jgi:hypothetical protein
MSPYQLQGSIKAAVGEDDDVTKLRNIAGARLSFISTQSPL